MCLSIMVNAPIKLCISNLCMHLLYFFVCAVAPGSGAIYTRWGRKTCPDGEVDLVYSGNINKLMKSNLEITIIYVSLICNHINIRKYTLVITILYVSLFR